MTSKWRNMVLLGCVLPIAAALPAHATDVESPAALAPTTTVEQSVPTILTPASRARYQQLLAALKAKRWSEARSLLEADTGGALTAWFHAQLLLAPGSPRAEVSDLEPLLRAAPELPQAARLASLASKRGAIALPSLPNAQRLVWAGSAPRRAIERSVAGDAAAAALGSKVRDFIKNDDPVGAEALLEAARSRLTSDGLTEWQQRIAWSYYIENDDVNALRLARDAARGTGAWAVQGAWVEGLAAWRQGILDGAEAAFARVGREADDAELRAAGHYWASRAAVARGEAEKAQPRLRAAARDGETFYGMLASEMLGITPAHQVEGVRADRAAWRKLAELPNIRAALALNELGEEEAAAELIRHQARIGLPDQHNALAAIAGAIGLPETQLFLAHNVPQGMRPDAMTRYPAPNWQPAGGWKVDSALVFAHTLQESQFRRAAVSPAGAQGLMQVRPGTARDIARWRGDTVQTANLNDPAVNMDFGQSYLQLLSGDTATGGLLPKVIAAYNAGPTPVARWATEVRDNGDPLLFIESIPYWETRGYVGTVLRNYWMYEAQSGKASASRNDLAQGKWPRFPGQIRSSGFQLTSAPATSNAD
jgi:soluble lytic murein transglycosylase-like protein